MFIIISTDTLVDSWHLPSQFLHKTGLPQLKQRLPTQPYCYDGVSPQLPSASHRVAPFLDLLLLDLHHLQKSVHHLKKSLKRMKGKMPTGEGEGHPGKLRYK